MNQSYYVSDYSGTDPQYLTQNQVFTLFSTGQTIDFEDGPVFLNSVVITTTDGQATPLVLNTDFTAGTIDYTAMSRAKNVLPSFSATLVKSISIIRSAMQLPVEVSISYQRFYANDINQAIASGSGQIEVTPDLVADMLRRLGSVERLSAGVVDPTAPSAGNPVLLDYDIDGVNANNVISNEVHTLNTTNGTNVIFPVQGSFFKDSVVLTAGSYTLQYGADYQIVGLDRAKTPYTKNKSGIYNQILVTYVYVGDISLKYHAVGGSVSSKDVGSLYTVMRQVVQFLNVSKFITSDALYDSPAYKSQAAQIQQLEDNMRSLLSGKPTYGDATNGVTVVNQYRANDTRLHWWNVATLFKVSGSNDIVQADRMSLHIQAVTAKYQADVDVAVDLTNTNHPVTIEARNVVMDPGFVLYGTVGALAVQPPMFRVIWGATVNNVTGAILQIGMALPNLTETLAIEDRSGVESSWILSAQNGTAAAPGLPSDTSVTLPDGSTVWTASSSTSLSVSQTLPYKDGYLISASQVAFTLMDQVASPPSASFNSNLPADFQISDIKSVVMHCTDSVGTRYEFVIPTIMNGTVLKGSAVIPLGRANNLGVFNLTIDPASQNPISASILGQATIADNMTVRYLIARV